MYRAARAAAEQGGVRSRKAMTAASLLIALLASGCASISAGPPRLYAIEEEAAIIRGSLREMNLVEFSRLDEVSRMRYRNDWLAGRMYAMDMQYTAYEAALTRERQGVGFGAAIATIGLTTASTLVSSVATKDILTGTAGAVTGARAAYDSDVLLAHSVQWIQSQMRTRRAQVAERILRGMKASTTNYPLAAALIDLEDYYRAGTFTGGMIATTETLGADARFSEDQKDERLQVTFRGSSARDALEACINLGGGRKAKIQAIVGAANLPLLLGGSGDVEGVLAQARNTGICP
jgi:hypothetical protein